MAKYVGCFSVLFRKKKVDKENGKSSNRGPKILYGKIKHPRRSLRTDELNHTFDVLKSYDFQKIPRSNVRVMSVQSFIKAEAEKAYVRESEHEDSTLMKSECSEHYLQGYDTATTGKSTDIIHSGQSDPGFNESDSQPPASPRLKRSCSNIERSHMIKKTTRDPLPSSGSNSYEDLQELAANELAKLENRKAVMTHCGVNELMLKRNSSTLVLPSGSKKLWCKLFLWIQGNKFGPSPRKSAQVYDDYSDEQIQNQWAAISMEPSSFARVHEWVKALETQKSLLPVDDDNNDIVESIVVPHSPETVRSTQRSPSPSVMHANNIVQSLNPTSSAICIIASGLKAIPSISHFSSLRSVNLSNNSIVHITPGLLPKSLHTLDLSRNKISNIEGLRELSRLRFLDLSQNCIARIEQGLSNCTLIKELYLEGNKISDVEGLHRLLKLTVLDLSFNKITTSRALGQLVANYNSIQALNLLGNPIQSNIGDAQLRKVVCELLPKLVYLNKKPIKSQRVKEVLTDSVAKAALGNKSRIGIRTASYSKHKGRATVSQRSSSRSKSRSRH